MVSCSVYGKIKYNYTSEKKPMPVHVHLFHNNELLCTNELDAVVAILQLLLDRLELGPSELYLHSLNVWYIYVYI